MNLLLINLPRYKSIPVIREERCEAIQSSQVTTPATLLIIAALLKEMGHKIDFIDANAFNLSYEDISKRIQNRKIDCIIFPFHHNILDHDLKICNIAKKSNPFSLAIGYSWYSRCFAKEILYEYRDLDIQIIGPSLSVIGNLMKRISENGNLDDVGGIAYRDEDDLIKVNNKIDSEIKLNDLPMPAYDSLPSFEPYYLVDTFLKPYATVYSGKGCPYRCKFCVSAKTKYSGRSADNVIKELKMLKRMGNIKYVWFFDEVFTINRQRTIDVCERIMEENINIKWFCDTRVDLVDEELLKIMRKAGCIGIAYGVESGNQMILNSMNKGFKVEQAKNALIWTRKVHIPIQLNLILGYIGEDEETLKETKSFVKTTLPETLQIVTIDCMPNTELSKLAFENKWVDESTDWKHWLTTGLELRNHQSSTLNLYNEKKKIKRMLYCSPQWWLTCIHSALTNRELALPAVRKYLLARAKRI